MNDVNEKTKELEKERKQYHPALCNAMELELYYDRDLLEFPENLRLNTLPREMDFLVIRKAREGEIRSELGRIFRRCNIWEFKGYGGELNMQVYHTAMSYAYEYLSVHDELNGIEDVTLSFLREGQPRELIKWLESKGYERLGSPKWVIRYRRPFSPDMQIVNIAHSEAPTVLKVLSHKANPADIIKASEYIRKMPDKEQRKGRLVMELSYKINGDQRGGISMGGFFEAYVDPLQDIIKKKDAELEENKAELEQNKAELEQNKRELAQNKAELKQKDDEIAMLRAQIAAMT